MVQRCIYVLGQGLQLSNDCPGQKPQQMVFRNSKCRRCLNPTTISQNPTMTSPFHYILRFLEQLLLFLSELMLRTCHWFELGNMPFFCVVVGTQFQPRFAAGFIVNFCILTPQLLSYQRQQMSLSRHKNNRPQMPLKCTHGTKDTHGEPTDV